MDRLDPMASPSRVVSDDPSTVRELVAHAAELFIEEDHHDNRD